MSKRGENIHKRKDGRWEGRYICDRTETGKAIYHSVYGKTYSEVKEKLRLCVNKKQDTQQKEIMPFNLVLDSWLENNRVRYKASTYTKYKYIM